MFPWHNPWRDDLQTLWAVIPLRRSPALRRSRLSEALFDLDLPACAEHGDCRIYMEKARKLGWQVWESDGWLHLWRPGVPLPEGWFPVTGSGEGACLQHLLSRHPGSVDAAPEIIIIRMLKAREEGKAAWETVCRDLHLDFSRRLRLHLPLPALPVPPLNDDYLYEEQSEGWL